MEPLSYVPVPSALGALTIVWQETEAGPKVRCVLLPNEQALARSVFGITLADASPLWCPAIGALGERIGRFLEGEAVDFDLGLLALERCSEFQRRVLLAEYQIPRGWVSTYGGIARSLGVPRGARAVGGALSRNPFPIVIPCHRAIRADGQLGGYRGGIEMKRALLQLEGVEVSPTGKVLTDRFYY